MLKVHTNKHYINYTYHFYQVRAPSTAPLSSNTIKIRVFSKVVIPFLHQLFTPCFYTSFAKKFYADLHVILDYSSQSSVNRATFSQRLKIKQKKLDLLQQGQMLKKCHVMCLLYMIPYLFFGTFPRNQIQENNKYISGQL